MLNHLVNGQTRELRHSTTLTVEASAALGEGGHASMSSDDLLDESSKLLFDCSIGE